MLASCPFCSQKYTIESSHVGSTISCSNCGEDFVVTAMLEGSGGQAGGSASTQAPNTGRLKFPSRNTNADGKKIGGLRGPESRVALTDKFFSIIFKLSKPLSAVFAIIFIIVLSLSLFSLTMTLFGNSVKTPTYISLTTGKDAKKNGLANLDSSREVEEEYGDQINDLTNKIFFQAGSIEGKRFYDFLGESVTDVSDEYRAQFLDGLGNVLDEAKKKGKDKEGKLSLTYSYIEQFSANIVLVEAAKSEDLIRLIAISFGSGFGLFSVLLLPAILRIERNLN